MEKNMKRTKAEEAKYLRELVDKTGNLYVEVAEFLGVNERTLYRWLSGESRIPYSVIRTLELITSPE
jgi:transcriptional regulator with PAS, ATPase and Fis domain